MHTHVEEYIHKDIQKEYKNDKELIEKFIVDFDLYIYNKYKNEYPLRLLSIYYLKKFDYEIRRLKLLPDEDVYEKISRNNELFNASMFIAIHIGKQTCILQIPFIVNVSELSRYIVRQNSKKVQFAIKDMLAIMTKDYQDDYDRDNKIMIEQRDILYEEKKRNPIIIMQGSKVTSYTIINGNHRIMYLAKMGHCNVEGYYIKSEDCCKFALTRDYEKLYKMILCLINKVNGTINFEKNKY